MCGAMRFGAISLVSLQAASAAIAPKLGNDSVVDWWFAYKLSSEKFQGCSNTRDCIFGGDVQTEGGYYYGWGQQYLLSSSVNGTTSSMAFHSDCIGDGADPVARTFNQIYSGEADNYVIWNDQFYREPSITLNPACNSYEDNATSCSAPWGHSKGMLAWDADGNGFVMQVTTPSWPGSGNPSFQRPSQGNTLGCVKDDNVEAAQHFFALKLTAADVKAVLAALKLAMVVTDPSNPQLVQVSGPSDIKALVEGLSVSNSEMTPYSSVLSSGVTLLAKPQALNVPAWQMVSSMLQVPLRTATWWANPKIPSAYAGTPGCWSDSLANPLEVQVATSGQWDGTSIDLTGTYTGNHAKLGHSLNGTLAIMGDMNQQGSYSPSDGKCYSSQNSRGGLFFVVDDAVLHAGLKSLLTGDTASYESTSDKAFSV